MPCWVQRGRQRFFLVRRPGSGSVIAEDVFQATRSGALSGETKFVLDMLQMMIHSRLRLLQIPAAQVVHNLFVLVRAAIVFGGISEGRGD